MKRLILSLSLVLGLLITFSPLANAVTPGTKCSKAGIQQLYKGKIYTCIKLGKKLYWNNGVKYQIIKPTPTPTPTGISIPPGGNVAPGTYPGGGGPGSSPSATPTPKPSASTNQHPNTTKPVVNLSLKSGAGKYTITYDVQKDSGHYDVVVFESLTGQFAGEQYIVYVGTSKTIEVLTGFPAKFEARWVLVRTRDQWSDLNISESKAGPVKPTSSDIDTSTPPCGIGQVCPGPELPPAPGPVLCRIGTAPWGKCP